jgi:GNAT superfamily N-acetyltransferase
VWFVHPTTSPADIGDRLRARGLHEVEACTGMSMALTRRSVLSDIPSGIHICEATTERDRRAALDLVAWRWHVRPDAMPHLDAIGSAAQLGMPGSALRCWIAWRDGVAVAKVMLYLAAGVAGVYGVVTRPEARGLGLAGLLTLEALGAARRAGYGMAVLHATAMAHGLYQKIGFRDVAPFRFFAGGVASAAPVERRL